MEGKNKERKRSRYKAMEERLVVEELESSGVEVRT